MKQILQNLKTGATEVTDIPVPSVGRGQILVETSQTLVSAGTERMLVEFGKASWIRKARQQPDKVRMVLDKIKTDGLKPTLDAVFNKLEQPLPLGYCNMGRVREVGPGVQGFQAGDRVISNGNHAEFVCVPMNLCAKVPDEVSDEAAAFTVLGSIALQGIRLVAPTLGETVVVTGLGLIGLVAVQLLRANGCRVLGLDFDHTKLELARSLGAEVVDLAAGQDPVAIAQAYTSGRGVDAVIVTASTASSEPIHQAALMCRKRGRIVLVGVTGLELSRADFFQKELTFQVSCSYGPGRYDPAYEQEGFDYPLGYVRWTEKRNFEAVLELMARGALNVIPLISHRFPVADAAKAYDVVGGSEPSLGILLSYPGQPITAEARTRVLTAAAPGAMVKPIGLGFIGSGNYATSVLIPAFRKAGARLRGVACKTGVSGVHAGRKFGFEEVTTDPDRIIQDPAAGAIVVATRHNDHSRFVIEGIRAGKHVFVEKPLCLTHEELDGVRAAYASAEGGRLVLMVGFNRRFSPQVRRMKQMLAGVTGPMALVMTVNAGAIPGDHWTQDPKIGGGRIIGEGCHFIDLLRHLAGSPISGWSVQAMDSITGIRDTVTIQLAFENGSMGTVHYFANGNKAYPKEALEVFAAGRILKLDNFRKLEGFGWPGFKSMNLWRQDKGQADCARAFLDAIDGRAPSPIDFEEIMEVSQISIDIAEAVR